VAKYLACRRDEKFLPWVSSFHHDKLPCRIVHDSISNEARGSYNWTTQVIFSDGESLMVRQPSIGFVHSPDEKVENEIAVMGVGRNRM
jgi:hypothetical protein